ncbi:calcium-binding protein [Phaeobacter marinintestinus]|uniref:calcium-binding protein n=1 Tax=Falsiphaeobacter marinintestinus TaxID=1492905 RepID=UPI0011B7CAEE|nr:calcium-binding protein [Phaeobacter marinintestinus]
MSTYSYDTFSLRIQDGPSGVTYSDFFQTQIEIGAKDGTGFSYTIDSVAQNGTALVSLDFHDTYLIKFDFLHYIVIDLEQAYVYDLSWDDGGTTRTTTLLSLDMDLGPDGFGTPLYRRYFVEISGDDLPPINDLDEFQAFLSQTTGTSQSTGAFGEGVLIPWGSTLSDKSKDNDFVALADASLFRRVMGEDDAVIDGGAAFDQLVIPLSTYGPAGATIDVAAGEATGFYNFMSGSYDTSYYFTNFELFWGTHQDDTFIGDDNPNQFRGMGGADTFLGGGGIDTVRYDKDYSQTGLNSVFVNLKLGFAIDGFGAQDSLQDIERVIGTKLDDKLVGDLNDNRLQGNDGDDLLVGLKGNDQLWAGSGDDVLKGSDGDDLLMGAQGADWMLGGAGQDVLRGGAGNDTVLGEDGNDNLRGGGGLDTMNGGQGNDVLDGGPGKDLLGFSAGHDRILGFEDDVDTLIFHSDLWGGDALTAAQILDYASITGGNIVFDFDNGNTLTVEGHTDLGALENDIAALAMSDALMF